LDYESAEPIFLVTDASLIGTGAWVGQGPSVSEIRPAVFHSRKFNSAQSNYSTFDEELLAIVDLLEHFRPVLSGCRFTILTDHKRLVAFPKQSELLGRQARWQNTINHFMCTIQYIDGYKNVIADTFFRVFINPEVLPILLDFIPSKIDSPEPPASTTINASKSAPAHSANSPLYAPIPPTPIVMSAASTTRSIAKKAEGTPCRPLLEIQIPKRQETGSPLAIAVPATPAVPASPLRTPTPTPQSAMQTIEQLMKAVPERYQTKKMQLPRHDPSNEAFVEGAGWRAQHAMMYWPACDNPTCVIHRSSHKYRKSFKDWNHCQYCNNNGHYTGSCPVQLHDETYTESPKLPPQRLQPGVPGWVLQMESLHNSSDISVDLPATPPQSATPPRAPTPPLDLDYDSSTSSETMNSSPPSPIMKLAPRTRSPGPNYSSDPETLPSYSPIPEAREYVFRTRIVYNDGANETTEELTFKSFNSADPDMESRHIPINGKGNKGW